MRWILNLLGMGRASATCHEPGCDEPAGKALEKGEPSYCAAHMLRTPSLQRRLRTGPGSHFRQDLDRQLQEIHGGETQTATAIPSDDGINDDWDIETALQRPAQSGKDTNDENS